MVLDNILKEICTSGSIYDEIINNLITPRFDLKPELISEIALSFLENKEKIERIYNEGYFKYYFINVVRFQIHSNTSSFHKNVRIKDYDFYENITILDDDQDIENKIIFEEKLDKIQKIYKNISKSWFDNLMWEEYFVKDKTFREIEKDWDIDHVSAFHCIKKMKIKIKKNIK